MLGAWTRALVREQDPTRLPQLEIPSATTKTEKSQINKCLKNQQVNYKMPSPFHYSASPKNAFEITMTFSPLNFQTISYSLEISLPFLSFGLSPCFSS